jgi:hypothetical protein
MKRSVTEAWFSWQPPAARRYWLAAGGERAVQWRQRQGEQGDARQGNLVAEVPAGDAHPAGAGRPQHGVIEIGPLLRLENGSHRFTADIHVLPG